MIFDEFVVSTDLGRLAEHRRMKAEMLAEEEKKHFSYDQKSAATPEERAANDKLT